jgi:hypothetical protein
MKLSLLITLVCCGASVIYALYIWRTFKGIHTCLEANPDCMPCIDRLPANNQNKELCQKECAPCIHLVR